MGPWCAVMQTFSACGGRIATNCATCSNWLGSQSLRSTPISRVLRPDMGRSRCGLSKPCRPSLDALQSRPMATADVNVAEHIVELERAALDRWGRGDPNGFLEVSALDVSYF